MRVTIGTGLGIVHLAGPTPREEAASIRHAPDFELQTVPLFRAANVVVYDRLNDSLQLSFEAVHQYATRAAGEEACLTHVRAIRALGKVDAALIFGYGASAVTYTLEDCLVKASPIALEGCSVRWSYELHGGNITGPFPVVESSGTAQITGANLTYTKSVTGLTALTGIVRVNQATSTGGYTQFIVAVADGSFTISVPQSPELAPGDGRVFNFTWDIVHL